MREEEGKKNSVIGEKGPHGRASTGTGRAFISGLCVFWAGDQRTARVKACGH